MLRFLAVLPLFLTSVICPAQSEPQKVTTVEGVTEYQLENGARVLLFPDPSKPTFTVNMTVLVGSRHEGYGEAGMAHLLEHMVFKGTPTFSDIPTALRDHGASFNGTTNRDRTNYFETLPANEKNLEFAIHMESDRLVNSFIKHEDLQSEFTVVRNEFERSENSPTRVLFQRVMSAAFEWHNYGKTTIGNRSDIERVPIDNLRAFYRKYYRPDNVVFIVTGKIEVDKTLKLVQKYLGSIPKPKSSITKTYTEEPPQDGERLVTLRRVGKVGSVTAAYHMPAAAHDDWAPLSILASVISEDKIGLLEKKLIETKLATSVSARADSAHDPGLFTFSLQPTEGKMEEAKQVFLETLDNLHDHKIASDAVDRAKMRAYRRSEDMMNNANSVAQMLSSASSIGDWRLMFLQRDRLQEVTAADVKRVAETYFPTHNRTVGLFIPTDEAKRLEVPMVASIKNVVKDYKGGELKEAGEVFDPSPENLDARITALDLNGLKVGMIQKKNRGETVNLTMQLHYGNEESLLDKTTAAGMISSMLMAGTETMDRQALRQRMSELGVRISPGGGGRRGRRGGGRRGGGGTLTFSIQGKRSSLVPAIELLGEIIRKPAFPEKEFETNKARMASMMKRFQTEPQMLASNAMSRALSKYEKGDVRYVPTTEESIERIENLTLDDIKEVYKKQLSSATGEIAIVGQFDVDPVLESITKILDDWQSDTEYREITSEAKTDFDGGKQNIETPDKANAVFSAAMPIKISDTSPDYEALVLGNFILGGGSLSSRLGNRIRQKEGLSYGVSSSISIPSRGDAGRFSISAITNPGNMDAVEKAAMEELNLFIDKGPSEQELIDARTGWLERQKVSRSSDGSITGQIISNLYLERDFGFTAEREKRVAELTPEAVQSAFKKHIDPKKLLIIRAGDFAKAKADSEK